MQPLEYRSIFISDVHLGTRACMAEYLLSFLKSSESEYLYLVGDIFDLWEMRRSVYWNKTQNAIVQEIFRKAEQGTKVVYIPGNHDSLLRDFVGSEFRGIKIEQNAVHETADERKFFVSHGDEFDVLIRHNSVLRVLGDHAYKLLLRMNRINNRLRRHLDRPYWSLSTWLKTRVHNANQYIDKFETVAAEEARSNQYDGYICGHIHKSGIRKINGALYCNDGDWVEHCTAITEDENGWLQLLHWSDHARIEATTFGDEIENTITQLPIRTAAFSDGGDREKAA